MTDRSGIWIFSNQRPGEYGTQDWDTNTILRSKRYYFSSAEPNRRSVLVEDQIIFREYGAGFWGVAEIAGEWVEDLGAPQKHGCAAGWFSIHKVKNWHATLPYEVIKTELSNQNHRARIARATQSDYDAISLRIRIYKKLGYGASEGEFLLLEAGIEEAIKANIGKIGLRLAPEEVQQQCSLGVGVGRTDLICVDGENNYVVLELKAFQASDVVIGQILRYMGFIRKTWAEKENRDVKGIVLAPGFDEHLHLAASEAGIRVLRVRLG